MTTFKKGWGWSNVLDGCMSCLSSAGLMLVFLVIGAGLSYWGWTIVQNARASSTWPTAAGQVIRSEVEHSTDADGHDSYQPRVAYQYVVRDVSYENDAIKFGENSYSSQREADRIAAAYPVGKAVVVHHHPDEPDQSVLEPGVSAGSYIVLGIGLLFVVITLIVAPILFFVGNRGSDR